MKVGVMWANCETARYVTLKLLESNCDVVYYCPDKKDLEIALNYTNECNMVGIEQNTLRGKQKSFSIEPYDLSECDVIGKLAFRFHPEFTLFD